MGRAGECRPQRRRKPGLREPGAAAAVPRVTPRPGAVGPVAAVAQTVVGVVGGGWGWRRSRRGDGRSSNLRRTESRRCRHV